MSEQAAWGDVPYDSKTPAEVVHDYVVIRGDLSEQYARNQLSGWIERYATERARLAWNDGWTSGVADSARWVRGEDVKATPNPHTPDQPA